VSALLAYYIGMPVNANGNGPACESETVRVLHQVWDASCATICEAPTEALARLIAQSLNEHLAKDPAT